MNGVRRWLGRHGGAILIAVLLLVAWELAARQGGVRANFFPAPSRIWAKFLLLSSDGTLLHHTWITLLRLLAAFAVGAVPGVGVGLLMGLIPMIRDGLSPIMAFIYPVPSVLWLPTVATFLGRGNAAIVLTSAVTTFFLVAFSTQSGVAHMEKVLLEAGRNYGATGHRFFLKVLLPGALPFIFSGLRLGLGFALIVVLAVEMLVSPTGLGGYLWEAWNMLRIEHMYATLMVLSAIGLISSHGVEWMGDRLMPWRRAVQRGGTPQ